MHALFLPEHAAFMRYHDIEGSEPVRVYLHGLGSASSADYPHIAAHPLLLGHRSLLVDLLGFGFSDRPVDFAYDLEGHAATVARLLDHLGVRGCQIIGHSMGGAVAILLADLRPDLVSALVVAEANLDPGGRTMSRLVAARTEEEYMARGYAADLERFTRLARRDSTLALYLGGLRAAAPHAMHRSARSIVEGTRPTMRDRFLRLAMPRCYLIGARSLPDPNARLLTAEGVPLLVVPEAGHAMMHENPEGFARAVSIALADSAGPRRRTSASRRSVPRGRQGGQTEQGDDRT